MGEYAIRKSDGARVKIGTCENLYWLRYEDRYKVDDFPGSMMNRYWRLPLPEEDGHEVTSDRDFEPWRRNWRTLLDGAILSNEDAVRAFDKKDGIVQTEIKELGILVNVRCHHGVRLNESNDDVRFFWNGKRNPLRIESVKNTPEEMRISVICSACGTRWLCSFNDIEMYIASHEMRFRLLKLCQEYWWDVHDDSEYSEYKMVDVFERDGKMNSVVLTTDPKTLDWYVTMNEMLKGNGDFEDCCSIYLACLHGTE